jgi:hypothetical protein
MRTCLFIVSLCAIQLSLFAQKNPCNPQGKPYSQIPGDTTIILPLGTQVTFNRCEFFDLRDCLEFDEIFNQASVITAGFTTQDRDGNVLLSCGMFRIRLTNECSGKTCFDIPVKVKMPYRPNLSAPGADSCSRCNRQGVRLFTSTGGNWDDSANLDYQITESNGQKYFEFTATCANKAYNCDCRIPGSVKVKFKAKGMKKLEELALYSGCPVAVLKFSPKRPRNKIKVKLPCLNQDQLLVSAMGTGKNGEYIKTEKVLFKKLAHGSARKNCKTQKGKVIRRILAIFPIREGNYFRKYFVP